jgi:superfamily II RNA helicase
MFSTDTLALGINAPARTSYVCLQRCDVLIFDHRSLSVFLGDSKFLSPLLYRQCAGRAGRRGFDLVGPFIRAHSYSFVCS